jgi:tetratricopeptide (TPR) repeat protein
LNTATNDKKMNVKVVAGAWSNEMPVALLTRLAPLVDLEVHVLEGEKVPQCGLHLLQYAPVAGMPGFYRDLEQNLLGADLVIAVGTAKLSSFQAVRFCRKNAVPCFVMTTESSPFEFEKYENVRAIQFDILKHADKFISLCLASGEFLRSQDVNPGNIIDFSTLQVMSIAGFEMNLRRKFRNYIGISEAEILITIKTSFTHGSQLKSGLEAFKWLLADEHRFGSPLRLLVTGEGDEIQSYKYLASDLRIGDRVLFLNQDSLPFWTDLCSASDVMIWDRGDLDTYDYFKHQLLQRSILSAIPVIFEKSSNESMTGINIHRIESMQPGFLRKAVIDVLQAGFSRLELSQKLQSAELAKFDDLLHSLVRTMSDSLTSREPAVNAALNLATSLIDFVQKQHAPSCLIQVEEAMLAPNISSIIRAELSRIKGDCLVALERHDEAVGSYEKALMENRDCGLAYRGLGYQAWRAHSHEEAMTFFRKCLALVNHEYHSLIGVGLIYRRLKMNREAMFWLKKALEVRGHESSAFNLLIQTCVESAVTDIAKLTLEELRETYGDHPSILRGLSQIYLSQGLSVEAGRLLQRIAS